MNILFVIHKYGVPLDDPCCYPLGAMYISSMLKKSGHNVKVLNYNLFNYDIVTESKGFDVALFTGFEEFLPYIKRDSALFKELGIKTIVGGALATFKPGLMAGICDTVVIGEAEGSVQKALTHSSVILGKPLFINDIPFPDYDGFGIAEYNKRHMLKYMGVLTTRGCPHKCTFCAHTCNFRYRNIESVFSEIDTYIEKYGVEYIVFNDNTFNLNKNRTIEISREMGKRNLRWSAALRLDTLDDETCSEMAENGCSGLIVGVESFNQRYLDQMRKGITVKQITDGLDLLHKYKLGYYGNVLFGLDGQTSEEIEKEVQSIPDKYNLFPAMVRQFVGTTEGKNRLLSDSEWLEWDNKFKVIVRNKGKYCYPDLEETC